VHRRYKIQKRTDGIDESHHIEARHLTVTVAVSLAPAKIFSDRIPEPEDSNRIHEAAAAAPWCVVGIYAALSR
jgi:hypothetical protein